MKCIKCGYENKKGIQYCVKCSNPVGLTQIEEITQTKGPDKLVSPETVSKVEISKETIVQNKQIKSKQVSHQEPKKQAETVYQTPQRNQTTVIQTVNSPKQTSGCGCIILLILIILTPLIAIFGLAYFEYTTNLETYERYEEKGILSYDNLQIEYNVPLDMIKSEYSEEGVISYHTEDYSKMISFTITEGNAIELLNTQVESLTNNENIQIIHSSKYIYYGNGYNTNYFNILYDYKGQSYTTIVGSTQIGNYVYMVIYDADINGFPNLDEIFYFSVI